jgi:hypothetical protein
MAGILAGPQERALAKFETWLADSSNRLAEFRISEVIQ